MDADRLQRAEAGPLSHAAGVHTGTQQRSAFMFKWTCFEGFVVFHNMRGLRGHSIKLAEMPAGQGTPRSWFGWQVNWRSATTPAL